MIKREKKIEKHQGPPPACKHTDTRSVRGGKGSGGRVIGTVAVAPVTVKPVEALSSCGWAAGPGECHCENSAGGRRLR